MHQFLEKLGPFQAQGTCGSGALKRYTIAPSNPTPLQLFLTFILPSQQSAILTSLEKEYGVFHGLLPDLELRRSKIQNLYGFRVKVCTCRKAVLSTVERWNVYQMMLY